MSAVSHSVSLLAQVSQITAIVWLCYSIRQLQLSKYTCLWENRIIGWSMSYPGTLGGAVPISTSGKRVPSGWPLYVTSNNKLHRHSRKMAWRARQNYIFVHFVYDVQWRSCLRLFQRKDAATVLLLLAHGPGKEILCLCRTQNQIQSDGTYTCRSNYQSNNLGVLIRL